MVPVIDEWVPPGHASPVTQECMNFCREWSSASAVNYQLDGVMIAVWSFVFLLAGVLLFFLRDLFDSPEDRKWVERGFYFFHTGGVLLLMCFILWYRFFGMPS